MIQNSVSIYSIVQNEEQVGECVVVQHVRSIDSGLHSTEANFTQHCSNRHEGKVSIFDNIYFISSTVRYL